MCAHCNRVFDRDEFVIKRSPSKLYGGGALFQAEHKRCHKLTLLPAQMMKAIAV